MDWVLNNLETVVVPIIIFILYSLGNSAQKKEKSKENLPQDSQEEMDPDAAQRVRQIQEEIRKKIAERTGRVPPPRQQVSPPAQRRDGQKPVYREQRTVQPPTQKFPEPARKPRPQSKVEPRFSVENHEREIEVKLRKVRELEAQVKRKSLPDVWGTRVKTSGPKGELRKQLFRDLSHPLGQKKAILIAEILGSPVGIKGPGGGSKANV